jgi:hypothetical protein
VTRYLCVDPSHGDGASVDLTAQVRLEREFLPRESAYLADSSDVVRRVSELADSDSGERAQSIRRILTGTVAPLDAPVVLVAGDQVDRVPGLYEMDELHRAEGAVASLLDRYAQPNAAIASSDDIVVLRDGSGSTPSTSAPAAGTAASTEAVSTQQSTGQAAEAEVLPQGVFSVLDLATRLAEVDPDEGDIVAAIRATPSYGSMTSNRTPNPWRVVVDCSVPTGQPPAVHRVIFTGTGESEAADVLGIPAVGGDLVLEDAARRDTLSPFPARRAERALKLGLAGGAILVVLLLVLTWISGGLALAARETPVWLGMSIILAIAAMAIGLLALASRSDAEGNANDTFVLRLHYASRTEMLWYATIAVSIVFALSIAAGVVPPVLASRAPIPSATITFNAGDEFVTTGVEVLARGLATDEVVTVRIRQYSNDSGNGVLIGHITATGDPSGLTVMRQTLTLDPGARFMSVLVTNGDDEVTACSPTAGGPGCTVVSVPPLGAGIVRLVPATSVDLTTIPDTVSPSPGTSVVSPTPAISPTPSAGAAASISPSSSIGSVPSVSPVEP